jgi:hypothetical protein
MGLMKRREFLTLGALGSSVVAFQEGIPIEVMEVFSSRTGPSALLVHHNDDASREAFANWLRQNSGKEIHLQSKDKNPIDAIIFRASLCFGRGLIVMSSAATGIRAKDLMSVKLRSVQ